MGEGAKGGGEGVVLLLEGGESGAVLLHEEVAVDRLRLKVVVGGAAKRVLGLAAVLLKELELVARRVERRRSGVVALLLELEVHRFELLQRL